MTAYELADEAYKKATTRFDYDVALTMKQLIQENSQQADRIDRLEREAVAKNNYLEQHCQKIDQQADRIAELEKECADWEKAFIKAIQESHVIK